MELVSVGGVGVVVDGVAAMFIFISLSRNL